MVHNTVKLQYRCNVIECEIYLFSARKWWKCSVKLLFSLFHGLKQLNLLFNKNNVPILHKH